MVVVPGPVEFVMGSPSTEQGRNADELQHKERIGRTFAMSAKPVTKEQFLGFQPKFSHGEMRRYSELACPIGGVTWYQAGAYCNWLSKRESISEDQWCYEMNPQGQMTRLKANYLSLMGYRLPTEAEWEYACRARAVTSRYYGESEELLGKYGWYFHNSMEHTWPVGSKKPNDLGLFDMHGNIINWCQESYHDPAPKDHEVMEDKEDVLDIVSTTGRVQRGGFFYAPASLIRSASRNSGLPTAADFIYGFRPARTLTP
jgi:formylglycine-generating enzyme required for sulfatase activity